METAKAFAQSLLSGILDPIVPFTNEGTSAVAAGAATCLGMETTQ